MRLYPASPGRRAATPARDPGGILPLCVFAWAGGKGHDGVPDPAGLGGGLQDSGRGIATAARDATGTVRDGFDNAGGAVSGVPLIGDRLAGALHDAGRSATEPVDS